MQVYIPGDLRVTGIVTCGTFNAPASSVNNASIEAAAGIEATKVVHRHAIPYRQAAGTAVVAETTGIHIARASGTVRDIEACIIGAIATDVSRTITIDVKKSTGAGAFATILGSTIGFTSSSVLLTITTATISSGSYIDGDLFEIVVTDAGGSGSQAQGLLVTFTFEENPE